MKGSSVLPGSYLITQRGGEGQSATPFCLREGTAVFVPITKGSILT